MNGVLNITIKGKEFNFRFGMIATEIFSKFSVAETLRIAELGIENISNFKSFACMVYAGLCNQADFLQVQYPSWEEAFLLAEDICNESEDLQQGIFNGFMSSRPTVKMLERLNGSINKAEDDDKKKEQSRQKRHIGKKSEPLHSEG